MAPKSAADTPIEALDLVVVVLMTAKTFNPDWSVVADHLHINTPSNAQRRFKAIIEKSGKYEYKRGIITEKADSAFSVGAPKSKKRKAPTAKAKGPGTKRVKDQDDDNDETDQDVEVTLEHDNDDNDEE